MSSGFRVFLLILAAFGAVYAYRFRHPEISRWLKADSGTPLSAPEDHLASPVDRVLERDYSLARFVWKSPEKRPELPAEEPEAAPVVEESPAGELVETVDQDAADLAEVAEIPPQEPLPEEGPAAEEPGARDGDGAPPPSLDHRYREVEYKVEPGDNLWKIAARKLGSGSRHAEIREWNAEVFRGRSADLLVAGTVLKLRIPHSGEFLKDSPGDVDSTVEGDSAPDGPDSNVREPSRKSPRNKEKSRRLARQ